MEQQPTNVQAVTQDSDSMRLDNVNLVTHHAIPVAQPGLLIHVHLAMKTLLREPQVTVYATSLRFVLPPAGHVRTTAQAALF